MSTTDTAFPASWAIEEAFPASWAIEEALKAFNGPARPVNCALAVSDVKRDYDKAYGATLIAYARLIEECKPELRPLDPSDAMQRAITVIWKDRENGYWDGSIQYAKRMLDKLAEQGFAVVRKESAQ